MEKTMIDPRHLRTFMAVCRERTISGAARALNISQPSVSVAIAQLERGLRTSLFARNRTGIVLTPAGAALERRAEAMEALLRDAEEEVALTDRAIEGPLRIGGTPGALVSLVPQAIARLDPAERLSLHILERPDFELNDLLRTGGIEIAVVTTGIAAPPPDIVETSLTRDPFALIVGRAHDRLGDTVSLSEAAGWGWVLPQADGAFYRQTEALFLAAEVAVPRDVIRCDSLLTSKAIVQGGARVALLPRGVVAAELAIGVLRALTLSDVSVSRNIGIRLAAGARRSPLAERFVTAMTDSL